jgi:hypothetical protein
MFINTGFLIGELTLLLQRLRVLIFECCEDAKEGGQGGSIQDLFGLSEALGNALQLPYLPNMCIKRTENLPLEWKFLFTNDHLDDLTPVNVKTEEEEHDNAILDDDMTQKDHPVLDEWTTQWTTQEPKLESSDDAQDDAEPVLKQQRIVG